MFKCVERIVGLFVIGLVLLLVTGHSFDWSAKIPDNPFSGLLGGLSAYAQNDRCSLVNSKPEARCAAATTKPFMQKQACRDDFVGPSDSIKAKVQKRYALKPDHYRIVHIIPLALGGTNDARNLYPLQIKEPGVRDKTVVGFYLARQVCQGEMSLAAARRSVENWQKVWESMPVEFLGGDSAWKTSLGRTSWS